MKIKASELQGAALDWLVAKAIGFSGYGFAPSTDWAQGGPIIEREGIQIQKHKSGWIALPADAEFSEEEYQEAATPLIAAMRCYVASKLGDEVEIPKELQ